MQLIPSFDPTMNGVTVGANGVVEVGAADAGSKMLLYNESQINLALDFYNGNQGMLHAWEARYWTLDGDTRQVGWSIESVLNQPSPPISAVKGELYGSQEKIEGVYPISLVRQASIAGNVNSLSNTISNEGAVINTEVVDIGTAANAKLWDIFNDHFTISIEIAGVKHTILQGILTGNHLLIGQVGDTAEVLGALQVDQDLFTNGHIGVAATGDIIDANNAATTYIKARSSGSIHFQTPSGTDQAIVDTTGILLMAGKGWKGAAGDYMARTVSINNGSGSGTYNHTLGAAPDGCLPYVHQAGSATVGYDSETSTQVHITLGAVLTFNAFLYKRS